MSIKDPQKQREYQKTYMARYRLKHPKKIKEINRVNSQKHRKEHKEAWDSYFNPYFKNWLKIGNNKTIHSMRTKLSSIKHCLIRNNGDTSRFREDSIVIYNNLQKVGWTVNCNQTLNHICSIKLLVDFLPTIDIKIVYDTINLELVTKEENNSSATRRVNQRVISKAKALEKKFECLKGFGDYVSEFKGKVI